MDHASTANSGEGTSEHRFGQPCALIVLSPTGQRTRVPVDQFPFTIGRQADNRLVLRDNRASREHCRILPPEGGTGPYVLEDLNSRHGTWLNGQRITTHPLRSGDRIDFGVQESYQLTFVVEREPASGKLGKLLGRLIPQAGSGAKHAGEGGREAHGPDAAQETAQGAAQQAEETGLGKLRGVVEVARSLQSSLSIEEVLVAVTDAALRVTGCERGFLLLKKNRGMVAGGAPGGSEEGEDELEVVVARDREGKSLPREAFEISTSVIQRALNSRRELLSMQFDPAEEAGLRPDTSIAALELRSVVCLPLVEIRNVEGDETQATTTARATAGVLYMDSKVSNASLTAVDRELLQALAMEASTILENARLMSQEREKIRLQNELNVARTIQQSLIPQELPSQGWLRASGSTWPSSEVGGDYFDAWEVSQTRWSAVVADVSGKGVSSALLAGILQGAFLMAPTDEGAMRSTLEQLNQFLLGRTEGVKYATVFYAIVDRSAEGAEGTLRYINAGHCSPILVTCEGKLATFHPTGNPVGMLEEANFEVASRVLQSADKVVIFSDGLTEAANADGEFYGVKRLRKFLRANCALGAEALREAILADVAAFSAKGGFHDDITVLVLEYLPAGAAQ